MADDPGVPCLEIAVVLIVQEGRVLGVYNPKWGSYTLPMTKRYSWQDPNMVDGVHVEDWDDAAVRAETECFPGTRLDAPSFLLEIPEYQQSDRDGAWKRYRFRVHRRELADNPAPRAGLNIEWLTPDEWLDVNRRPISKTARDVIRQVVADARLRGAVFP
jgi:hypothetical protein